MSTEATHRYDWTAADAVEDVAFNEIFREFHPRLVRYCRFMTGDLALGDDLAQEVLLRALHNRDRLDPNRPLWPWLKVVANNLVIDQARKREREARLAEAVSEDAARELADGVPQCLEERPVLRDAMQALPVRQRAALSLRYVNDWTPQEAADALGMSAPAFKQLLFRARRALSCEYRRLTNGDRSVAGWLPFPLFLPRLRGRVAKLSSWFGNVRTMTAVVAADTLAALAVVGVVAGSGLFNVKPPQAEPDAAVKVADVRLPVVMERADSVRRVSSPPKPRPVQALLEVPRRSTARRPGATAPAAPAVPAPKIPVRVQRPSANASMHVGREGDRMSLTDEVEMKLDGSAREADVGTHGTAEIACDGTVTRIVCDAMDGHMEPPTTAPAP